MGQHAIFREFYAQVGNVDPGADRRVLEPEARRVAALWLERHPEAAPSIEVAADDAELEEKRDRRRRPKRKAKDLIPDPHDVGAVPTEGEE